MFSFRPRIAVLAGVVSSLALIGSAAPAQAIIPTSNITTPADPTYLFDNEVASPELKVAIVGTANVPEVDIRCYDGKTPSAYSKIAEKVKVTSGEFSLSASSGLLPGQPCVLRAVPTGDSEAHPPGTADPFAGPRVIKSFFNTSTESSVTYDYDLEPTTLAAYLGIEAVGDEALYYSYLFAPGTLIQSESGFYDNGSLTEANQPPSGSATRSELQIDGANAYSPYSAREVGKKLASKVLPGTPSVSVSTPIETGSGEFAIQESDPIVKCVGKESEVFPPTKASCEEFVPTGVQLNRTWQATHEDRVALMVDNWSSTDAHAHALDALYNQEPSQHGTEGAFQFPGASSFSSVKQEQTESLPAGPGIIYYKTNAATPEGGDLENPQLAIVYDTSTDGAPAFHTGSVKERPDFEMHYARTVPASGALTLRMGFVTEYSLAAVRSLAGEVLASYQPPSPPPPPPVKPVPPPPAASATQIGSASGANGKVSFKVACKGVAGQSCKIATTLTTTEKLRGSKIVAISAKRHRPKTRTRKVTVGAVTITIPAGQTVGITVNLNSTGRKLLARYHKLPVHLSAVLVTGSQKSTVIAQNLTVKPAHKKHKKSKRNKGRR